MLHFCTQGQNSFLGKVDPRAKIIAFLFLFAGILLIETVNIYQVLFYLLVLIVLILSGKSKLLSFVFPFLKVYPMIFIFTFLLPFQNTMNHPAEFFIGSIPVFANGLLLFLEINLKFFFIFITSLLFIYSTSYGRFLKGLSFFKIPEWIIAILFYLYRLIFLMGVELERLYTGFRSRYIHLVWWKKLKVVASMTGVFLVRSVERSENQYYSMISRNFVGEIRSLDKLIWRWRDSLIIFASVLIVGVIKLWEWI